MTHDLLTMIQSLVHFLELLDDLFLHLHVFVFEAGGRLEAELNLVAYLESAAIFLRWVCAA